MLNIHVNELYLGICYKYITDWLTDWYDAREKCKSLNADLFSIHSQQENDLVHSKIVLKIRYL